MISVRSSDELHRKISILMKIKGTTKTEIIKQAVSEYYVRHAGDVTPYELGSGLFGKYGAGETLSEDYKRRIKGSLHEKHNH